MKNTTGRDNKMYYVSDGFNLNDSNDNQFTSLLTLNNIASSKSTLTALAPVTPRIPNIRSQVIPSNSTLHMTSPKGYVHNSDLHFAMPQ